MKTFMVLLALLFLSGFVKIPMWSYLAYGGEWIVDTKNGCKVWNPEPKPYETINWSGKCVGGIATGLGVLEWYEKKKLVVTGEGYMRNGRLSGEVTLILHKGVKYVGEVDESIPNGNGTITFPNGTKYTGEFRDGKPNGTGTKTSSNGTKYVGEFKDGNFNGSGNISFKDGGKYTGEFKDNKPNGTGTRIYGKGDKYTGEFKSGKPNGTGTKIFSNGGKYTGEFKNGKPNGIGTLIHPDGRTIVVAFENGKLIRDVDSENKKTNTAKDFLVGFGNILGAVVEGYGRSQRSAKAHWPEPSVLTKLPSSAFYDSEEISGLNKTCYYDNMGSKIAITVGITELCPR